MGCWRTARVRIGRDTPAMTYLQELTPAAYQREAERLRHMAHRAARCHDLAPSGFRGSDYPARLEKAAQHLSTRLVEGF